MATPDDVPKVIDPLSQEILHSDVNWFLVEFAPTGAKNKYEIKFSGKGKGGLAELRENLKADDRIFYGSLQVNLIDENGAKYDKYVYFKYLPNKANKAKRFLWNFENSIKTSFKFKHVLMEYLDENLVGFDEEGITKEFLRVSENQMEYKSIDFGGGNVFLITNGNIKRGRPADMDVKKPNANAANDDAPAQDEKVDYPDDPPPAQEEAQQEDAPNDENEEAADENDANAAQEDYDNEPEQTEDE